MYLYFYVRFTELYVEELESESDLRILVSDYLKGLNLNRSIIHGIIRFDNYYKRMCIFRTIAYQRSVLLLCTVFNFCFFLIVFIWLCVRRLALGWLTVRVTNPTIACVLCVEL